mmetsp:Transcript_3702/g.4261  ORF Transcript_3702/g.4261 Transcript_3702/m.4261 type:complete len:398 (-) Transcript_3702:101-1294(-)|eukprot:CAMPEP_0204645390 /NCGR_PEP_ID=MMETSP0718-20130828/2702_1 /ASSEMBLY_ACC=CAM_ASM_000674 /TAXON_ID=230516 /ORGANISM="Chaetoceros curvisetus" /LENGTH=397 /DNA_ID=CAMNT_0051667311 /DNA_START=84 /DNA_END=1277 /DNA_ORIENTATION=+
MIIREFQVESLCRPGETIEVKLRLSGKNKNLKLDPRVNNPRNVRFDIDYHHDGETVTLTTRESDSDGYTEWYNRIQRERNLGAFFRRSVTGDNNNGGDNDDGNDNDDSSSVSFSMRVFDPQVEELPDFDSQTYRWCGIIGELAPSCATVVIIDPSVKTIPRWAFANSTNMRRIVFHGGVEVIHNSSFVNCQSLEAVFLPHSIKAIAFKAFGNCSNMRIFSLPQHGLIQMDINMIRDCHCFMRTTRIHESLHESQITRSCDDQVIVPLAILEYQNNLPPLHRACLDFRVSAQSIHECIVTHGTEGAYARGYGGITPMHILALNPHATTGSILTLFHINMCSVFEHYTDSLGPGEGTGMHQKTPLDFLLEYDVYSFISVMAALCKHRDEHINMSIVIEE